MADFCPIPLAFGRLLTYDLDMEISKFPYVRICGPALAVCLLGGCAARSGAPVQELEPAAPETHETEELPAGVFHRVLPGQTLWRIARTYGIPLERIVEANGVSDPTRIAAGDMVWIPGVAGALEVEVVAPSQPVVRGEWIWPVAGGAMLSGYGAPRRNHVHGGVDIGAAYGEAVLAARDGRVIYSGTGLSAYGKTIVLDHGDGVHSLYAHNSALLVLLGDSVKQGETIARIGRTGNATADHCHFEIRVNDRRVDPMDWIDDERRAAR